MRVQIATGALLVGLAVGLGGWFTSGYRSARMADEQKSSTARRQSDERAIEIAAQLRTTLAQLQRTENARPYYEFSNLFHDPRGVSQGFSVAPSPLANGPADPLVRGYFQIARKPDGLLAVTMPTINDDVPELDNNNKGDAELRAQITTIAANIAIVGSPVVPTETGPAVAVADTRRQASKVPTNRKPRTEPPVAQNNAPPSMTANSDNIAQQIKLTPDEYQLNNNANAVFQQAQQMQQAVPNQDKQLAAQPTRTQQQASQAPPQQPAPRQQVQAPQAPQVQTPQAPQVQTQAQPQAQAPQVQQQVLPQQRPPSQAGNQANVFGAQQADPNQMEPAPQAASLQDNSQLGNAAPPQAAEQKPPQPKPQRVRPAVPRNSDCPVSGPTATTGAASLMITVYAYDAKTVALKNRPTMMALRQVATPDGVLTQGFALDAEAIRRWLSERAAGAELSTEKPPIDRAHAPLSWADSAWSVTVPYPAAALAAGTQTAAFVRGFIPLALLVAVCGALVIWVLLRTDKLARQQARFAASAAHELRTPLAGLQLYGDMLADNLGDPSKSPSYARRVADEASRLGRVVSNMLGVSQLERGNIRVDSKSGDVVEVVNDVITSVQPGIAGNGASIEFRHPESAVAHFDRDALTRIVANLLDNAEKYSRSNQRDIVCEIASTADLIAVRVIDHGPGVTVVARRLFKPFQRGAVVDGPAGLGLGLALSRTLARAMGGDLVYRRNADDTTTFELQLPTTKR
jgi:signal transduction histidine kinase